MRSQDIRPLDLARSLSGAPVHQDKTKLLLGRIVRGIAAGSSWELQVLLPVLSNTLGHVEDFLILLLHIPRDAARRSCIHRQCDDPFLVPLHLSLKIIPTMVHKIPLFERLPRYGARKHRGFFTFRNATKKSTCRIGVAGLGRIADTHRHLSLEVHELNSKWEVISWR